MKNFSGILFLTVLFAFTSCYITQKTKLNTLAKSEIEEGWYLFFDDKSLKSWKPFTEVLLQHGKSKMEYYTIRVLVPILED